MLAMAWTLLAEGGFLIFALAHAVVAGAFLWVARDLTRRASLVDSRGLPHLSVVTLFAAVALLRVACPAEFGRQFGFMPLFTPGLAVLGLAVVVLAIDDRNPSRLIGLVGRLILIIGGLLTGIANIIRMMHGLSSYTTYSLGLGVAGLLLVLMALFEGRLLRRAISLAFGD